MKNKEFLNICYKYFNKFINSSDLIKELNDNYLNTKIEDIKKLIIEIENIISNTSITVEDNEEIKKLIDKLEKNDSSSKILPELYEKYNKKNDSYDRWFKIVSCINDNSYFNECFNNLSKYELLEFISQYISAPFPPKINQKEFDELVKEGIKHDEREWLWRLAFNYENSNLKFDLISDYYIEIKDMYYLSELISSVGFCLDIDLIIDKVLKNNLAQELYKKRDIIKYNLSDEQYKRLFNENKS